MIREHPVYRGPLVSLTRYDHPSDRVHRDPTEETSSQHSVSFIDQGAFDLFHRGRRWRMDPAVLFVTHPGLAYRCGHAEPRPDDVSFSVHYSPRLVDDVQRTTGRRWMRREPAAPNTNRLAYLRHRLEGMSGNGEAAMAVPALAGELLAALGDSAAEPSRLFDPRQLAWYARRVDAARDLLSEGYAESHSLEAIARQVGMSPFHFSRVFRWLVGIPPHRYLVQVRLRRAARRLEAGSGVTEACHATGFNNLSHFIRTFRRAYGVPPSRYRH
jgi:AraC family transcriptional regulator